MNKIECEYNFSELSVFFWHLSFSQSVTMHRIAPSFGREICSKQASKSLESNF